jgi:hypothetical protein
MDDAYWTLLLLLVLLVGGGYNLIRGLITGELRAGVGGVIRRKDSAFLFYLFFVVGIGISLLALYGTIYVLRDIMSRR